MNDQVVMSKSTGNLAIAVPLFRVLEADCVTRMNNYAIMFMRSDPLAYVIDTGLNFCTILGCDFCHEILEFLGDL